MEPETHERRSRGGSALQSLWAGVISLFDSAIDGLGVNLGLIRREAELFFGTALLVWGFFGFRTGRYCDGNTADYLSCTRPTVFYYYDTFHVALILLGIFFILLWILKRQRA
jgi:hypothetical protein